MADCRIFIYCDDCMDHHPFPVGINVPDEVIGMSKVGDLYDGKEIPEQIIRFENNSLRCPKTRKMITQKDHKFLFIAPV